MFKGVTLLAVVVLGCCLVSSVSAITGCGGCSWCDATPAGGWGAPSGGSYWGMSVDDILNDISSSDSGDTTGETEYIIIGGSHAAGNFNWGVSNVGKFASLGKLGDSQSIPSEYSSILKPDSIAKPDISAIVNPDFDVTSNLINKQLFF